jgi:tetratricopeptide (TPR) repeat protein
MPGQLGLTWMLAATLLAECVVGCGGNPKVPPGADPERMSESEYDVAVDLWRRRGKPREALSHGLEAIELNDRNSEAFHLVGLLYLDLCRLYPNDCRLAEAERHARAALTLDPEFREARNTLGVILIHQRKLADAIATLQPLTADILYQTPENAWGNLGWAYLERGDTDKAIDALRRSVAAQPLFCVGNYRLGLAYFGRKDYTQALEAFSRALDTADPGCQALQEAYLGRAKASLELSRMDGAHEDLDRCVAISKASKTGKECDAILRNLK